MDIIPFWWCYTIPKLGQRRMYAKALLNAGLQIGQLAGLPFLYGGAYCTVGDRRIYLAL